MTRDEIDKWYLEVLGLVDNQDSDQMSKELHNQDSDQMSDKLYTAFLDYFKDKSPSLFAQSEGMKQPSLTELIEHLQSSKDLEKQIDRLSDFVDSSFSEYLRENLNREIGHRNHSPIMYVGKTYTDIQYIAPEIAETLWINFKITKLWLNKLEADGFLRKL
jgi:hypothetical protein